MSDALHSVKRETGENPVRSRHCISEVLRIATGRLGRHVRRWTDEPGDLPDGRCDNHEELAACELLFEKDASVCVRGYVEHG